MAIRFCLKFRTSDQFQNYYMEPIFHRIWTDIFNYEQFFKCSAVLILASSTRIGRLDILRRYSSIDFKAEELNF